jgi:tetratricopeptide (TPR) repeat protein
MRHERILLALQALMLAAVLISGCTMNIPGTNSIITPVPVPAAVDLNEQGFRAFVAGNHTLALDFYNQSIAVDPKYTRAWINKGDVLVRLNRTSEAVSSYDSALGLENNLAIVWNSRGEAMMAEGDYTGAYESFNKSLQIAPEYVKAKENRNLAKEKMK